MALTPGTRLGPYAIVAPLGAGGMGEVYRARDTKLDRDVALKLLPEHLAHDAERLARFEREAKTLAALNHPHIAQIHGLEDANGTHALVMELVEGPTLAERIAVGPLPLDEALPIARQIAEALEAAHDQGIVHRDLKPANIKVRPDGTVKVLDFGLAKAVEVPLSPPPENSPTITSPAMTMRGVILGTAAYMSPEQAKGKPVDRKADVWAFGCVLFEMLTGHRAFEGDDVSDTLAMVLKGTPAWDALPAGIPTHVNTLVRRCIQRDLTQRLPHIGLARLELTGATANEVVAPAMSTVPSRASWRTHAFWAAAAMAVATLAFVSGLRSIEKSQLRVTFTVLPPDGTSFGGPDLNGWPSVSPDGRSVAFVARRPDGRTSLWIRQLDVLASRELAGTEDAVAPFWSPDGERLGYFGAGRLKAIELSTSKTKDLAEVPTAPRGATWNQRGDILFACFGCPLYRVSFTGGQRATETTLEETAHERGHYYPQFVPDGRHYLFVAAQTEGEDVRVFRGALGSSSRAVVPDVATQVAYSPTGHLLYGQEGSLVSRPYDLELNRFIGPATTIVPAVVTYSANGGVAFSVSQEGVLVYRPGGDIDQRRLVWLDRAGRQLGAIGTPDHYSQVAVSPDGTQLGISVGKVGGTRIRVVDAVRGTSRNVTAPGRFESPSWSGDGRLAFVATSAGPSTLYLADVGSGEVKELGVVQASASVCAGRLVDDAIAYSARNATGQYDVWRAVVGNSVDSELLQETESNEFQCGLSADGRWLALVSDRAGESEVFVQSVKDPAQILQVSRGGAMSPVWSDSGELFFLARDSRIHVATIDPSPTLRVQVKPLFDSPRLFTPQFRSRVFDVAPGGQRFVFVVPSEQSNNPLIVSTSW